MLNSGNSHRMTPFDIWWSEPIIVDTNSKETSRKSLVTIAANQDGGAHVDPSLDEIYGNLTQQNSMGWMKSNQSGAMEPMGDPTKAALRQISHELIKTVDATYSKERVSDGAVFGNVRISNKPPAAITAIHFQGPNDSPTPDRMLCPCGSGETYLGCHKKV